MTATSRFQAALAVTGRRWAGLLLAALALLLAVILPAVILPAWADQAAECAALTGLTVPPEAIGLPTGGAVVVLATLIRGPESTAPEEHCRVLGRISPDPAAAATKTPDINFQLNLPSLWNGRALQMGGGGYNGTVVTGVGGVGFTRSPPPLFQGYATYGSDSGHIGLSTTGTFGSNPGAVENFAYAHLKKTHDVALAIIKAHYGRAPDYSYFAGASSGGREALTVVQRFPADYDGVIANAPAIYFWGMRLIGLRIGRAMYETPGGFLGDRQFDRLRDAVLDACDADDGLIDGIVSDVERCRPKGEEILATLACPATEGDGAGDGIVGAPGCFSPAQLQTVHAIADDLELPYALAYGVRRYPGYGLLFGVDFARGLGIGSSHQRLSPPDGLKNGYLYAQGDSYIRYFVVNDPAYDGLRFNIDDPGQFKARLIELSAAIGAMNPDTSAFQARGGRLIMLQGWADDTVSADGTVAYYQGQLDRFGPAAVDRFLRFYMVPGFGHGRGAFIPSWDALGALDRWVSDGVAPETLVANDANPATAGRSRPLCRYPGFPRYRGNGNPDDAGSFVCVTGAP